MIALVILGGGGDLTSRYLAPALGELAAAGRLGPDARILATGRADLDDAAYRVRLRQALERAGADASITERFSWARADATSAADLRRVLAHASSPPAVYLALPPKLFPAVVRALEQAGAARARLAIEKPFGTDLASAKALNALLAGGASGISAHRVDHFLGLQSVRNLAALKAANRAFDAALVHGAVARVEITWDETLTLEGRADYYDGTGALCDMVQNHLLQVLAAIALEPIDVLDGQAHARARLEILRRTRARRPAVRARYGAGEIEGRRVPAYVEEEGVEPGRRTETFVSVEFEVDTPRWHGTPFIIRTGKALARDRMQVSVVFRPAAAARANEERLTLELQEPAVAFSLALASPDGRGTSAASLQGRGADPALSAYGRVLDDVLRGGTGTSIGGEEAEAQWSIVEPALEAFRDDRVPLLTYPAGSAGPSDAGGLHG